MRALIALLILLLGALLSSCFRDDTDFPDYRVAVLTFSSSSGYRSDFPDGFDPIDFIDSAVSEDELAFMNYLESENVADFSCPIAIVSIDPYSSKTMGLMGMRRKSHVVIVHKVNEIMKIKDFLSDSIENGNFEMNIQDKEYSSMIIARVFNGGNKTID